MKKNKTSNNQKRKQRHIRGIRITYWEEILKNKKKKHNKEENMMMRKRNGIPPQKKPVRKKETQLNRWAPNSLR